MKGFTLIELLVVVLIIGILAAIALPQYQKAVEKSRALEAINNIAVARKNMDLFLLNNGGFPSSVVSLKEMENMGGGSLQGGEWGDGVNYETDAFDYGMFCERRHCAMEISRKDSSYTLVVGMGTGSYGPVPFQEDEWSYGCVTQLHDKGRSICKSLQSFGFTYYDDEL